MGFHGVLQSGSELLLLLCFAVSVDDYADGRVLTDFSLSHSV